MNTWFHISLPKISSYHLRILRFLRFLGLHKFCFLNNNMNKFALLISSNDKLYSSMDDKKILWIVYYIHTYEISNKLIYPHLVLNLFYWSNFLVVRKYQEWLRIVQSQENDPWMFWFCFCYQCSLRNYQVKFEPK